jgi:periplasmic protein CpxP/Spy
MDKNKLMTISIIGLLLLNLCTLGFLFLGRHHGKHPMPKHIIAEKLNFDETQMKHYEELIHEHRSQIGSIEEKKINLRNQLYGQLLISNQSALKDSLLQELGKNQMEVEAAHYQHFVKIKSICKLEQAAQFEHLVGELSVMFSKKERRR